MAQQIKSSELLADLRNIAAKLEKEKFTKNEYDKFGKYSSATLMRRFGSFNRAKEKANIEVNRRGDTTTKRSASYRMRRVYQIKKSVGCQVCNYDSWRGALQFHHLQSNKKNSSVSILAQRGPWEKLLKEMKKCIIVCANCHRELEDDHITYK